MSVYVIGLTEVPKSAFDERRVPPGSQWLGLVASKRVVTWQLVYQNWVTQDSDRERILDRRWRSRNAQNQPQSAERVVDAISFVRGWYAQIFAQLVTLDPAENERLGGRNFTTGLPFLGTNFAGGGATSAVSITEEDKRRAGLQYESTIPRPSGPNDSEEFKEWIKGKDQYIEEYAFEQVLSRTGRVYLGMPMIPLTRSKGPTADRAVWAELVSDGLSPAGRSRNGFRGLFEAPVNDYDNRFDCFDFGWDVGGGSKLRQSIKVAVFTDFEYLHYQSLLRTRTDEMRAALNAGLTDARGGPLTAEERDRAVRRLKEKLPKAPPQPDRKPTDADLRLRLINAQAALILSMAQIRQIHGTPVLRKANDSKYSPQPSRVQIERARHKALISYDGDPSSLINLLANPFPNKDFLNATPDQLGRLQPKLEFRIDGKLVPFPEYTSEKKIKQLAQAKKLSPSAQENFLKKRGYSGTDVGIKTFDWVFENKMEGNSTIKAHLVLHFKSMLELLNQNYLGFIFGGELKGLKKQTPVQRSQAIIKRINEMKKSSNFAPTEAGKCDTKTLENLENGGSTRPEPPSELTVMVGWQTLPAGNAANDLGLTKSFREGVTNTQRMLRLKMIKYDLSFNQNGSVDLTLEYIGGLDALLSNPDRTNIFNSVLNAQQLAFETTYVSTVPKPDDANDLNEVPRLGATDSYKESVWPDGYIFQQINKKDNLQQDYADGVARFGVSKAGIQYELKTLRELKKLSQDIQAPEKELNLISQWSKTAAKVLEEVNHVHQDKMFSSFLDSLVMSRKLYYVTVGRGSLRSEVLKKGGLGSGKNPYRISIGGQKIASALQAKTQAENLKRAVEANLRAKKGGKQPVEGKFFLDPTRKSECIDDDLKGNFVNVFYFRLGDLIDNILSGMEQNCANPLPDREIILGSFYPYIVGIPNTSPDDIYSISDIPISLDYFGHWFLKNYSARQNVPQASFRRFMDDLMMDLVAPLFNKILKMPNAPMDLGRFTFGFTTVVSPLSMPSKVRGKRDASNGRLVGITEMSRLIRSGTLASKRDQKEYFVVTAKQIEPELTGNKKFDESIGIYHMIVGADRGLVKNFNFSQIDIPYYKEMRIEQNNQSDALFIPQNVELKLIGNAFFRNSSQVFVNANFGLGASAEKLGLGGYYTVTRVSNSISPGKFETTLSCVFVKKRSVPIKSRRRGGKKGLMALDSRLAKPKSGRSQSNRRSTASSRNRSKK